MNRIILFFVGFFSKLSLKVLPNLSKEVRIRKTARAPDIEIKSKYCYLSVIWMFASKASSLKVKIRDKDVAADIKVKQISIA